MPSPWTRSSSLATGIGLDRHRLPAHRLGRHSCMNTRLERIYQPITQHPASKDRSQTSVLYF